MCLEYSGCASPTRSYLVKYLGIEAAADGLRRGLEKHYQPE